MPLALSVLVRWMVIVAILLGIGFVTKYTEDFSRRVVVTWVLVTPALLVVVALYLHEWMRRLLNDPKALRRVAFVGCTDVSLMLADRITRNSRSLGMTVHGFFDDRSPNRTRGLRQHATISARCQRSSARFIATSSTPSSSRLPIRQVPRVMELVQELRNTTVSIYYLPDICALDLIQARMGELLGMPVVSMCETPFYGYGGLGEAHDRRRLRGRHSAVRRPADGFDRGSGEVQLTGPGAVQAASVRSRWTEILVYKFRTMTVLEDGNQVHQATRMDSRVTRIGRFLRRYSLDELPQLFNVLSGTMSLRRVRARTQWRTTKEYRQLIKGYMVRHKAPPGITGLAQINGCRGETARVGRHAGPRELRPRVPASLVAAARSENPRPHGSARPEGRQGVLTAVTGEAHRRSSRRCFTENPPCASVIRPQS